jgi:hypothetical protein
MLHNTFKLFPYVLPLITYYSILPYTAQMKWYKPYESEIVLFTTRSMLTFIKNKKIIKQLE